jgi:NAD+ synthetase
MNLQIALAQFRPSKGDPDDSFARISTWLGRLKAAGGPELVVFPETAATGYFLEGGIHEHALSAAAMLARLGDAWERAPGAERPLDVVIGFYEREGTRLYNAALYAEFGAGAPRLVHVHRKVFLPTYGVFQEERFVEAGDRIAAFDTRLGRVAVLICEDVWYGVAARTAVDDGARLLIVPSASPARGAAPGPGMPGNLARWERLARATAAEHGATVVVSQLVGFEGGKGFAGGSLAVEPARGIVHRSVLWDETLDAVTVEIPPDREAAPATRDSAGDAIRATTGDSDLRTADPTESVERGYGRAPLLPGDARDGSLLDIDVGLVEEWLVRFLRDEMVRRRGFEQAVVGLSGGVDSSVTAALCARAFGPGNVHGFLMPYATSSPESAEHATLVAGKLGIETREIEITAAVDGYLDEYEAEADSTRRGNVMARTRMIVLFDQAAKLGALPIGTGNKSERLLGYFTWHADDSPPINPLGDLFKTQVWAVARHLGLPGVVIDKPATADLVRGQTDEADLGVSYGEADLVLLHLVEGRTPEWLEAAGFEPEHVRSVRRRLESTHWKRNLPTVAMLSSTTIGEWYLRPVDY